MFPFPSLFLAHVKATLALNGLMQTYNKSSNIKNTNGISCQSTSKKPPKNAKANFSI